MTCTLMNMVRIISSGSIKSVLKGNGHRNSRFKVRRTEGPTVVM